MKKSARHSVIPTACKYLLVMSLIIIAVFTLIFSPELYKLSDLNFGPCAAFLFAGVATLVWDSVDD